MSDQNNSIGVSGFGSALPQRFVELTDLPLVSARQTLAGFGFSGAWVADDIDRLAVTAGQRALADAQLAPGEVNALFFAGALPQSHLAASEGPGGGVLDCFCYSGSRLQEKLELGDATICGIAQQGCAGMFSALRHARALLAAEPELTHVLCVGADALPAGVCREILYNVISDAACAAVVSRVQARYRWVGYHQISKGYYWDVPAKESEIIAAYFPSARATIAAVLKQTGLRPEEVDLVIPTGVNATSWPILLRLCGIPQDRLYQPRRHFGHTIAADSFLVLEEARTDGALKSGMRLLLFAYGFGSSWCALILEVSHEQP